MRKHAATREWVCSDVEEKGEGRGTIDEQIKPRLGRLSRRENHG